MPVRDLLRQVNQGGVHAFRVCAASARYALHRYLWKTFPIANDILFTPGNFDEMPWAVITGHREFVRLMKQARLSDLMACHPALVYRPYRRYLARSFTKKDRRTILKHHYGYLLTRISDAFFLEISRNKILLWQKAVDQDVFTIKLSFTGELQHEGDLLLEFEENAVRLYHMSFTIAPGYLTGSKAADVVLIGHVLGIAGRFDAIRHATKACLDIAPPYLLMAAVQGLSDALNVHVIAAVRNKEQITATSSDPEAVFFDYDAFWRTHVGSEGERFYLISVPIPEKSLTLISASHRRRTRLKRQFRSEVAEAAKANFRGFLNPL